ncbi:sensor histidine kinase [Paraburkholderia sp. 35.1]|uniref:sensor histidine kinase n=1 Tax=Paraburkholderia sp. 35.1 TaxID=2991058 RepID=UPI003D23456C
MNAVQHGAGNISVDALGHGGQLTLVVSNEGNPIPAAALPTLFDPLTRASRPPRQSGPSSSMGLGLYISRCIAHAHNGTIQAGSKDGRTTFTVQIPRFPSHVLCPERPCAPEFHAGSLLRFVMPFQIARQAGPVRRTAAVLKKLTRGVIWIVGRLTAIGPLATVTNAGPCEPV